VQLLEGVRGIQAQDLGMSTGIRSWNEHWHKILE
jgi:hypothetical protein